MTINHMYANIENVAVTIFTVHFTAADYKGRVAMNRTGTARTEPARTEPAQTDTNREPARTEPARTAEPVRTEPARTGQILKKTRKRRRHEMIRTEILCRMH